jgi:hypothetical protein
MGGRAYAMCEDGEWQSCTCLRATRSSGADDSERQPGGCGALTRDTFHGYI